MKDAWKLPTVLDPFFHRLKEYNRYIKCLETRVKFCHNALKLISGEKNYKPFSSLMYNNKYNFGSLKNILGKSERRDYGREAWWLNCREFRFQGRLEVSRRAAGLWAWAVAMGMTGPMEGGLTPCSARQECATWRTPRASTQTNPGPMAGRGENSGTEDYSHHLGHWGMQVKDELKKSSDSPPKNLYSNELHKATGDC